MSLKNFMSYDDATTVLGEYADKVNELKSGLTNVDVALSVPEGTGKNVIPMTLAAIKAANTSGTWSGNAYTYQGVTYTVNTDDADNVVGISANGTASEDSPFRLYDSNTGFTGAEYILNGCTGGSNSTYDLRVTDLITTIKDTGEGATISSDFTIKRVTILIRSGYNASNLLFYPMIRPATITDPTFAPYIPSVESRIEAVERGLTNVNIISDTVGFRVLRSVNTVTVLIDKTVSNSGSSDGWVNIGSYSSNHAPRYNVYSQVFDNNSPGAVLSNRTIRIYNESGTTLVQAFLSAGESIVARGSVTYIP